jgi:hypothetical protein
MNLMISRILQATRFSVFDMQRTAPSPREIAHCSSVSAALSEDLYHDDLILLLVQVRIRLDHDLL